MSFRKTTIALFVLLYVLAAAPARSQEIAIAAAADLKFAMTDLATQYEKQAGVKVKVSYGSSGNFSRDGEPWPQVGIRARDIEAIHRMASEQGLPIQFYEDHGCGMVLKFWDPFGNLLVVHQDPEGQA